MKCDELTNTKESALHSLTHKLLPLPCMGSGDDKGKVPLVKWKDLLELSTIQQVEEWFNQFPNANVGYKTGAASGILVIDNDGVQITEPIPITPTATSREGHYHFYFKNPDFYVPPSASKIGEHLDVRCDQGIIVAPPSKHFDKKTGQQDGEYRWCEGLSPCDVPFAPCPLWLIDRLKESIRKSPVYLPDMLNISEGSRDNTMLRVTNSLLARGARAEEAWLIINEINKTYKPPLDDDSMKRIFKQAVTFKQFNQEASGATTKQDRIPINFQTLDKVINKWLLIKDKGIIKVVTGIVIANKLKGDPVWLIIVTSSGGMKTELIRGLNKIDGIYSLSDLTPQTFLSGEKGNKDASLLLRIPREVILTFKDFTTVLTMHRDKRHAILSQLREIYDGEFKKPFGTGETKEWKGKLGFIAGVTSVIDNYQSIYQTLGERFVQYRPLQADPIELSLKAMGNSGKEQEMREEIQNAFADFITGIKIPEEKIVIPEELKNKIAYLSAFCVRARSGVIREGYSTREIELIPDAELPTRLAKQLITLTSAFSLISGGFTDEDYELIYKIGMDTLPKNRKLTINALVKAGDYRETADVAMEIGYPTNTTRRILEDLHGLKLINRQHKGQGTPDKWIIRDDTKELLQKATSEYIEAQQELEEIVQDMEEAGNGEPAQGNLTI